MARRVPALLFALLGLGSGLALAGAVGFGEARAGLAACQDHYVALSGYTSTHEYPPELLPSCARWNGLVQLTMGAAYFGGLLATTMAATGAALALRRPASPAWR
jgi:hypothetical protein